MNTASYFASGGSIQIIDVSGAFTNAFNQGLYGIGIAGVGMLSAFYADFLTSPGMSDIITLYLYSHCDGVLNEG